MVKPRARLRVESAPHTHDVVALVQANAGIGGIVVVHKSGDEQRARLAEALSGTLFQQRLDRARWASVAFVTASIASATRSVSLAWNNFLG